MVPKRIGRDDDAVVPNDSGPTVPILTAETLRSTANNDSEVQLHHAGPDTKTPEEKVSVFWRIFGGTILSIVALVIISVYQSVTSTLKDLNGEINQLKESKSDFVKKDDYTGTRSKLWEQIQKDQANLGQQAQTITALKGAADARKVDLDRILAERREGQAAMQTSIGQVRDRQSTFDQQLRSAEQALRTMELQLKGLDQCTKDIQAANVAVSALQAAAASRDVQRKLGDDQRAELSKAVAELRERLTRLEVTFQNKPAPKPASKSKQSAKAEEEDPDGR